MREIKFRTWNKVDKTMYDSAIHNCKDTFDMVLKHPQIYEVMQYTGLKDKNDKEIYEGDILLYDHHTVGQLKRVVTYKYGAFGIEGSMNGTHIVFGNVLKNEREVIGNIYENLNLLKEA